MKELKSLRKLLFAAVLVVFSFFPLMHSLSKQNNNNKARKIIIQRRNECYLRVTVSFLPMSSLLSEQKTAPRLPPDRRPHLLVSALA